MKLYNSETGILPSMPKDFRVQISQSDTFQMFYPAWHTKPGSYSLAIDQQMQTKFSWYSGSEHKRKPVRPVSVHLTCLRFQTPPTPTMLLPCIKMHLGI